MGFSLIDDRSFGFLSVYAPTESHARSAFWDAISQNLPSMDTWIVGGDFNNIELPSDVRIDGVPRISSIAPCERENWDRFLLAIRGSDAWHLPSFAHLQDSLLFSWGFRRQGGRLLERLDRFYIDSIIAQQGGLTSIVPGTALSDHAPISL